MSTNQVKRKELLRKILPKDNTGRVRFTNHISGSGERLFDKLEELKLEGSGDEAEGKRLLILTVSGLVEQTGKLCTT